jgi:tRNA (guanine37-N1)-methyltransferase
VYFTPRLATERRRVVSQVDPADTVFDMFAGVGPYAIPMASRGASVIATDINETAIEYLRMNVEDNDVRNAVTAITDDVRNQTTTYAGWASRIVMNLPHSANEFLPAAVELAGSECTIHYYDIQPDDDPFGPGETAIKTAASPDYDVSVDNRRIVRSYSPHEVNVCLDVTITKP